MPVAHGTHRGVWFSRVGTLLETSRRFVERAPAGYAAAELDNALHVQTRDVLVELLRRGQIVRERIGGLFIYLAPGGARRAQQRRARRKLAQVAFGGVAQQVPAHEVKAALILFYSVLEEHQRRLFAGLESMKMGPGSDARVAALLGLDPHTVAKGRVELVGRDIDPTRVRKAGAARNSGANGSTKRS